MPTRGRGQADDMTTSKLARRAACAVVATAATLVPVTTVAAATAVTRPFDLYTSKTKTKGQAHVYGTVTFLPGGNVRITGKLNDNCPEDGYGAYVYFTNSIENGNYATAQDTRGCKVRTPVAFDVKYKRPSYEMRIDEVHIKLKEYDQINPPYGAYIRGDENRFVLTRK